MNKIDIVTLRYIAGNIEQDQREHSARKLRDIADRLEAVILAQRAPTLSDEQIAETYRDAFESMPGCARSAPQNLPPLIFAFARAVSAKGTAL